MLTFITCGHLLLWHLCRSRRPADGIWLREAEHVAKDLHLSRTPGIFTLEKIHVPTTAGILRPRVLLPPGAGEFTAAQRRATLVHELTHVRGHDPLFTLVAHLVLAVHWCNPFAWSALRSLRQAQERHCDDAVIASGSGAGEYADILVGIASGRGNRFPAAAGLALAMAKRSSLHHRIQLILDRTMKRKTLTPRQKFTLGCAVIGLAAPLALTGIGTSSAGAAPGAEAPGGGSPASELQERLAEIRIEKIDLTEATLEEGADYLRDVITEQGHEPVNIVILNSVGAADPRRRAQQKKMEMEEKMHQAMKAMKGIEQEFGVMMDRESLARELSKARAALEESLNDYENMATMSPAEIAIARPESEFVRGALEKLWVIESEDATEEGLARAQAELDKRCREFRHVFKKRLDGMHEANIRLAERVKNARAYGEAEERYQEARASLKHLENQEAAPGAVTGAKLVTLQLEDISLPAALKYIALQAGVELSIETEAVVFGKRADFTEQETGGRDDPPADDAGAGDDADAGAGADAAVDAFEFDEELLAAWAGLPRPPAAADEFPPVRHDLDPADVYLTGYMLIREAEAFAKDGKRADASSKFREAQKVLSSISQRWPQFETKMVRFRLETIGEQLRKLEGASG